MKFKELYITLNETKINKILLILVVSILLSLTFISSFGYGDAGTGTYKIINVNSTLINYMSNETYNATYDSLIKWGYNQTTPLMIWAYNQSSPYDTYNYNMTLSPFYYNQTIIYTAGSNLTLSGSEFSLDTTSLKNWLDTLYASFGSYFVQLLTADNYNSILTTNGTAVGLNGTRLNQSVIDVIEYNQALVNNSYLSTYNVTYAGSVGNSSYLSTYNESYSTWLPNYTNSNKFWYNQTSASGNISGAGTAGYIPQWKSGSILNNSVISQLGGNVGIGTTTPSDLLTVASSGGSNAGITINASAGTGQADLNLIAGNGATNRASRIDFFNTVASATVPRWTILNDYNQDGTNDFNIVNGTSSARVFTILQSGNVGIGTTKPGYKLDVYDTRSLVNGEHFIGEWATGNTTGHAQLLFGYRSNGSAVTGNLLRSTNSLPLFIGTTGTNQAVTILDAGNVGIGTTAPGHQLSLDGTGMNVDGDNAQLYIHQSTDAQGAGFALDATAGTGGHHLVLMAGSGSASSVGGFGIWDATASKYKMLIKSDGKTAFGGEPFPGSMLTVKGNAAVGSGYSTTAAPTDGMIIAGNVGIGTTSPVQKLQVAGNVNVSGTVYLNNKTDISIWMYNQTASGGSLDSEINVLRQSVYELKTENNLMKQSLCKLGEIQLC